jgi:putative SOS response-associated peptidase YedK
MCGRYTILYKEKVISEAFQVQLDLPFTSYYNATPSTLKNKIALPVISSENKEVISLYTWGLVPFFSKEATTKYSTINARLETILTSPAYKIPIRKQRCLVLANCYFEWTVGSDGKKQPHVIFHKDSKCFAMAGIWDVWSDPIDSKHHYSFSIITSAAYPYLSSLHSRMPLIIKPDHYNKWLSPNLPISQVLDILADNYNDRMNAYPVSNGVNIPGNQSPDIINPIGDFLFNDGGYKIPSVVLKDRK